MGIHTFNFMQKSLIKSKEEYLHYLLDLTGMHEQDWPGYQVPEWLPLPKPQHYPCVAISSEVICHGHDLVFEVELIYFTDFLSFN